MAISDKLNYLIETKQLFKDRLNSLGAEIIESTTFRNYLNWLDTFYGEVSDKTDLGVNGVVGRTSQESTTGKNLFDYTTSSFSISNVNITTENNTITMTTATTTNSNNLFFKTKIPDEYLINGETYTISSDNVSGVAQSLKLQLRNKNGDNANKPQLNNVVYDNTYSLFIVGNIYSTNSQETIQQGTTAIIKNVQVEKSSTVTSYEPYTDGKPSPSLDYSQPINNLSGDVSYNVSGKNLINITDFVGADKDLKPLRNWSIINGNTIQCQTAPTQKGFFDEVPLDLPSGTYTISGTYTNSLDLSDTNDIMIRIRNSGGQSKSTTYTTIYDKSSGDKFSLLFYKNRNNDTAIGQTITETFTNVQLEQGSETPYEPYISESFPLSLKSKNLFDESLMTSIGGTIKYIPINVKKDTDYTLSTNSGTPTLANVFLSTTNSGATTNNNGAMIGQPRTINSGDNNIMYVGYRNDLSPYWVQLEENPIPTDYEPYYDIELCNISDYKDQIYSQNGKFYLEKKNDKIVLDETMTYYKSATTSVDKYYTRLDYTFDSSIPRSAISNRFIYKPNGVTVGQFDYSQNNQWLALFFCYAEYNTSTIDDFKNYVKNNETYCIITLPTSTTTQITQENYPTLYSQLLAIQEFLTKYKINKEFLLDYSSPEIKY